MTLPYFHVDTRNERLKTLAGKHGSLWSEFNQKLDISWIFHDHGLEGTVLQFQEIAVALNSKVASDNSFLPMYQEIKNVHTTIQSIREQAEKKTDRITKHLLQQCYGLLTHRLRGIPEGDGIRQEDGRYGAYYHKSCPFTEIEQHLKKVITEANQTTIDDLHPIVQATRFHFQMMKVMPYGRFSGKIARLIANLMLMHHGYPPAILHTVERARYYEALAEEDEHALLHLVIEGLSTTVESGLQFIEEGLAERRKKREARKALKNQQAEQDEAASPARRTKSKSKSKSSTSAKKKSAGSKRQSAKKGTKSKSSTTKTTSRKSTRSKSS